MYFLQKDDIMLHFTQKGSSDITGFQCLLIQLLGLILLLCTQLLGARTQNPAKRDSQSTKNVLHFYGKISHFEQKSSSFIWYLCVFNYVSSLPKIYHLMGSVIELKEWILDKIELSEQQNDLKFCSSPKIKQSQIYRSVWLRFSISPLQNIV